MNGKRVVAVTGATGFLGLHLVPALAHEGAQIRILVRRESEHELWRGIPLDVVPGSLEDARALERLAAGAGAIVHVAGLIKARDRAAFLRTNRDGTHAIAQAARLYAPEARFVAISSLAAREPQLSGYAASKHAGEEAARAVYADALDRLVIVRPPATYGSWDRETLAIFNARLAMGAGVAGLYALADTNPAGYRLTELLSEAARAVGGDPRFVRVPDGVLLAAGKASTWWGRFRGHTPTFTVGKAREMLHPDWSVAPNEALPPVIYQSKIGISEGFRQTAAWYKTAKWLT